MATLAVVALQQARQNARDAKRMADMKQVQTALELFFNENGRYPTTEEWNSGSIVSSSTGETFMYSIPSAPTPADGDCLEASNSYAYIPSINGDTYTIDFCTGKQVSDLPEGAKQMTPGGIIFGSGESGGGTTTWSCGDDFTDTRDNNVYPTVQIGTQCWFAKNLAYLPVVHSNTEFATQGTNLLPGYGVYDYDGNDVSIAKAQANYSTYGVLYNWYVVNQTSLCPTGWHVPSHDEFTDLERAVCLFLGNIDCEIQFPKDTSTSGLTGSNEGSSMAGNYGLWEADQLTNDSGFGTSGFDVIPGGYRSSGGLFNFVGWFAYFWSSSYSPYQIGRYIGNYTTSIYRHIGEWGKVDGLSIRCLKD